MQIVEGGAAARLDADGSSRRTAALATATAYFLAAMLLGVASVRLTPRLSWGMSATEFARNAGYNDPGSFVTGALDIARLGWISAADYWLVHLWPPGLMALEGGLMRVLGEGAPILLPMLALSAACCAVWMTLLRQHLLAWLPARVATMAPVVPFLFPLTTFALLTPLALAFGETYAISLFITAFLLLLTAQRNRSWWQACGAGVALAGSAYFRSQFESLVTVLTLTVIALAVVSLALGAWRGRSAVDGVTLRVSLTAMVVAQLMMAPWRVHNYVDTGRVGWVQTLDVVATNSLATREQLLAARGGFVIEGGGHLACELEPSYCGASDPALFIRAFLHHPFAWVARKAQILPKYWLAPPHPRSVSGVAVAPKPLQVVTNLLLLLCIPLGLWRLWRIRREPQFALHAWFQLSTYAALCGIYTLAQLEARYFYLPKIFAVVALLSMLPAPARRTNHEVNP